MLPLTLAASLVLQWEPSTNALEYVAFCGPVGGAYEQSILTTNVSVTFSNLVAGTIYKFGLVALGRDNGSDMAVLVSAPYESVVYLEWAPTTSGPWEVKASNVFSAVPGFYRGRIIIR